MPVADARHGLRGLFAERPVPHHVVPVEARIHLPERGEVVVQELLGVHAREWVAARDVIGHIQVTRRVALGWHEVGVLDQTEERDLAVCDVRPVRGAERTTQLEKEHDRGLIGPIVQSARPVVGPVGESACDERRCGEEHSVGATIERWIGRTFAGAPPVRTRPGAVQHEPIVLCDAQHLAIHADLSAELADLGRERLTDRAERSARVAELFLRRAAAAELSAQAELRPEPCQGDAFAVGAELPEHQRRPHRRQSALTGRFA